MVAGMSRIPPAERRAPSSRTRDLSCSGTMGRKRLGLWSTATESSALTWMCRHCRSVRSLPKKQRDNFDSKTLGHEWVWLRNPVTGNYSYGKGSLKLKGTSAGPDSTTESPTMLLRRQEHINFTATTAVSLENPSAGERSRPDGIRLRAVAL